MSRDLLNALYSNNKEKAQEIFNKKITDKQDEVLNVRRVATASKIFNNK